MAVLVEDPKNQWDKMLGETPVIQKLNGYLAETFIASTVPNDECLIEARMIHDGIVDRKDNADTRQILSDYLNLMFNIGTAHLPNDYEAYEPIVAHCYALVQEGEKDDRRGNAVAATASDEP